MKATEEGPAGLEASLHYIYKSLVFCRGKKYFDLHFLESVRSIWNGWHQAVCLKQCPKPELAWMCSEIKIETCFANRKQLGNQRDVQAGNSFFFSCRRFLVLHTLINQDRAATLSQNFSLTIQVAETSNRWVWSGICNGANTFNIYKHLLCAGQCCRH